MNEVQVVSETKHLSTYVWEFWTSLKRLLHFCKALLVRTALFPNWIFALDYKTDLYCRQVHSLGNCVSSHQMPKHEKPPLPYVSQAVSDESSHLLLKGFQEIQNVGKVLLIKTFKEMGICSWSGLDHATAAQSPHLRRSWLLI